ncbi:MAG: leucine-rich repeat domain-containing protein [[Eubacterium] siraeum]|nr:leucine-rich repeat domain-containing protein [[Eubacterium] siraeum]
MHGAAFGGCTSLKKLTIPDTVRVIEQHAFANCTSLEKVTLSENTFISRRIFYGCEKYIFTHLRQAMK